MKVIAEFRIGSYVFFNKYKDYAIKDEDFLDIMDTFLPGRNSWRMNIDGKDVFLYRNMSKQMFIKDAIDSKVPMRAGKFLVPEFARYLKMTIQDLKELHEAFELIDDSHKYEKVIYDSYIKNGDFTLTEEQRLKAYEVYKKYRNKLVSDKNKS